MEALSVENVILFIFSSITISFVSFEVKKRTQLPAFSLIVVGGVLLRISGIWLHLTGVEVEMIELVDPKIIFLGLVPALVFEASASTDWHTFKQELPQIVALGSTVVVLNTCLVAVVVKELLYNEFTWSEALLIGVLLSATDHVALAAQFKEVKCNSRFETLVEGETSLNEATILVLFSVMVDSIQGELDLLENLNFFVRISFGGLLVGILFSLLMGYILKRIVNDQVQEVNLTLIFTYMVFYVCECSFLEVSGGLATTALGLYMCAYGKTLISSVAEEALHAFWKQITTNIESIIFVMGGVLVGVPFKSELGLHFSDLLKLILVYVLLQVIRGLVLLLHYPLLKNLGYGLTLQETAIIVLSGFKGVISIALGLVAFHEEGLDARFKNILLMLTVGVAALSLVFNSILVKLGVSYFEMETLTPAKENMILGVTTSVLEKVVFNENNMKKHKDYNLANWKKVSEIAGPKNLLLEVMKFTKVGSQVLEEFPGGDYRALLKAYSSKLNLTREECLIETRRRFFSSLKGLYWEEFESGQCLGDTALVLMNSCDRCLDKYYCPVEDWEVLENDLCNSSFMKGLLSLSRVPLIGFVFKKLLFERIVIIYDAASTFVRVHKEAEELMDETELDVDKDIFNEVMNSAKAEVARCEAFIRDYIVEGFTDVMADVQTKRASHSLLISQRELIQKLYKQGIIQELECTQMIAGIDSNLKDLSIKTTSKMPSLKRQLRQKFPQASQEEINQLCETTSGEYIQPDKVLFKEGEECNCAYLVINGRVKESSDWIEQELSPGNIVGVQHLLPSFRTNTTTASTISMVYAAKIPRWLGQLDSFLPDLYIEAAEELIQYYKEGFSMEKVKKEHVYFVTRQSQVVCFEKGEEVVLESAGLLLQGRLNSSRAPSFLEPYLEEKAVRKSFVLVLPEKIGKMISEGLEIHQAFHKFYFKKSLFAHSAQKIESFNRKESTINFREIFRKTK